MNTDRMESLHAEVTDENLTKAIKKSLKESGIWNRSSCMVELEAAVVKMLEEKRTINTIKEKPQQPKIVELINHLILDYIDHMGYSLTKNIFMKESGTELEQNECRKQITSLLDLEDSYETLGRPLLQLLISMFKDKSGNKEFI